MIVDEISRLASWGERHRRLVSRLVIALALTAIVDVVGAVLIWAF